jgi:hypothetical protein
MRGGRRRQGRNRNERYGHSIHLPISSNARG